MNDQQKSLIESLIDQDAKQFAYKVVTYVAHAITGKTFTGKDKQDALAKVEAFAKKYPTTSEIELVLNLPDGVSTLTLWIKDGKLQMDLVAHKSSPIARNNWKSHHYSSDWLPINMNAH